MDEKNEVQEGKKIKLKVTKAKKSYTGRRAILALVLDRSESTQWYVMTKLQDKFKKRDIADKRLRKMAKQLGVKVGKLELK